MSPVKNGQRSQTADNPTRISLQFLVHKFIIAFCKTQGKKDSISSYRDNFNFLYFSLFCFHFPPVVLVLVGWGLGGWGGAGINCNLKELISTFHFPNIFHLGEKLVSVFWKPLKDHLTGI